MKTKTKISAYILRSSTAALLFSCVIVALCSAINLPHHPPKALPPRDNTAFGANAHGNRTLSFADRVAYQRAIEDVYWRHRIWPDTNPGPKPSLDAVMSRAEIEKKVTDYLRDSRTLQDDWQRPITAGQLQTEMERMASHTKQPEVLRELFEALGNDPFVIAECLARSVLTQRLVTELKNEERVELTTVAWLRDPLQSGIATAERQPPKEVAAIDSIAKAVQVNRPYHLPVIANPSGTCTDDTWTPTTLTNAPSARDSHAAVWTGTEMIVWGGTAGPGVNFNSGGRYNPSTDSWTATSTTNAPSPRVGHRAVWSGSEMIVWSGFDGFSRLNTGGRYDPDTDSWTATSTTNAPSGRTAHTAQWSGSEMIVWGGNDGFGNLDTGGRYDPSTDSWTATSTTNAPSARQQHGAVWTGTEMIVWGGTPGPLNTGGRYDPGTDSWTATSTTNAPSARSQHRAIWTGTGMIVWGGLATPPTHLNTGGRYCAQPSVCVFLQGFWKNHPEAWPVTELQLGNVTYTQEELLSILHEPVGGNGLLILAHQLIAAKLNIANGADGSCIHQTLADADSLIGDLVVPPVGNGYLKPRDTAGIAGVLGSYNEGNLCAPSCDIGSLAPRQAPRPRPTPLPRP